MIDTLTGKSLDDFAYNNLGVNRLPGETDVSFRDFIVKAIKKPVSTYFPSGVVIKFSVKDQISTPVCECGSEKAKTPGHSFWCPKYEA